MEQSNKQNHTDYKEWLQLKRNEFLRMGYGKISEQDLWDYLTSYRWKKGRPTRYHQIVNDIMHTSVNDYFNYETLKAQVYEVKSIDQFDLDGLI